jgi:hypothetical protein
MARAVQNSDFAADTIFSVLPCLSSDQSALFASILWSIWKCRNLKVCQQVRETAQQVYERATHMLVDWKLAHEARKRTTGHDNNGASTPRIMIPERWTKPAHGRLKCNVDASLSTKFNIVGIGMCIRDAAGDYVLACTT